MGCFDSSSQKQVSTSKTPTQSATIDRAVDLYGQTLGQNKVFPGETVAPFAPLQTGAIAGAGNFQNIYTNPQTAGQPLATETGAATRGILTGQTGATPLSEADINRFTEEGIATPAYARFERDKPLIDEAFAGPGFFGSGRSNAILDEARRTREGVLQRSEAFRIDALRQNQAIEEAKAGRTLAGLSEGRAFGDTEARNAMQNLEIAASQVQGLKDLFGFGAAEQTQEQTELQAELSKWMDENEITDPENLAILLSLLGIGSQVSIGSSSGPGLGFAAISGAAGGAGEGLGAAAGAALIASDERVKENIEPLDSPLDKLRQLKAYTYNYIGDTERHIGMMAQDIEKVLPEAVIEIDGVKHVKIYALQTLLIAAINEMVGARREVPCLEINEEVELINDSGTGIYEY